MAASTFVRVSVFVAFVGLGVVIKLTQHGARTLSYNPLCPMVVVSVGKLCCSLALYLRHDGSLEKLAGQLRASGIMVRNYLVVAALYCLYDVLSFVSLGYFDPQTYTVLLQLRIVTTAMIWELAFGRTNCWSKRFGLVLIAAGCAAKQAGNSGSIATTPGSTSSLRYVFIAVQVLSNSLASVANEVLLKKSGDLPLNAQNMVQYSWTIAWCLLVGVLAPVERLRLNPLDLNEWAPMLDVRMVPNIVVLVVLGLVTSNFLKMWDSVWKSIATAIELFLTALLSAGIFGYHILATDVLALCILIAGIRLFIAPGSTGTQAAQAAPFWKQSRWWTKQEPHVI